MTPVAAIIEDLKREEGFRRSAYKDHLGYWTIGYGTLIDERKGGGITEGEAEYLLSCRVEGCIEGLRKALPWFAEAASDVQRALVLMAYQMGLSGLLKFRKMLAALERGDREEAAREALDSAWARQTPARAARVVALLRQ